VTPTEVGLLLCDLDRWSRIHAATLVVDRVRVPWVALTTSPRGPAWGGLLSAGVEVVLPANTRLEQVSELLQSVVQRQVATPADERIELETAWRERQSRHKDVTVRIGMLTPREREVLHLMYEGCSVARIADSFGVTPATVRTQVKGVLRKLDVNSQLAAVAAVDDALDVFDLQPTQRLPTPQLGELL
jgi:DNA-binding NarL/FixJ family response regulator